MDDDEVGDDMHDDIFDQRDIIIFQQLDHTLEIFYDDLLISQEKSRIPDHKHFILRFIIVHH